MQMSFAEMRFLVVTQKENKHQSMRSTVFVLGGAGDFWGRRSIRGFEVDIKTNISGGNTPSFNRTLCLTEPWSLCWEGEVFF